MNLTLLLAAATVPIEVVQDPARYRPNDSPMLQGNPARARQELGWQSTIPLSQTTQDLLEYWRARVRQA